MKFKYEIPDEKTPGYLRREKRKLDFLALNSKAKKDQELLPEAQNALIEWLLEYVTEPKKREDAVNALLDASEEEVDAFRDAILTEGQMDPKASENSEDG